MGPDVPITAASGSLDRPLLGPGKLGQAGIGQSRHNHHNYPPLGVYGRSPALGGVLFEAFWVDMGWVAGTREGRRCDTVSLNAKKRQMNFLMRGVWRFASSPSGGGVSPVHVCSLKSCNVVSLCCSLPAPPCTKVLTRKRTAATMSHALWFRVADSGNAGNAWKKTRFFVFMSNNFFSASQS